MTIKVTDEQVKAAFTTLRDPNAYTSITDRMRRVLEQYEASRAAPAPQGDCLGSKPDFHSDRVEQLAFELAFELEAAELSAGDLVTVNRDKLRAIASRILAATPAPLDEALKALDYLLAFPTNKAAMAIARAALSAQKDQGQ